MKKLRAIITVVALAATGYIYGQCPAQQGYYTQNPQGGMYPQSGYSTQYGYTGDPAIRRDVYGANRGAVRFNQYGYGDDNRLGRDPQTSRYTQYGYNNDASRGIRPDVRSGLENRYMQGPSQYSQSPLVPPANRGGEVRQYGYTQEQQYTTQSRAYTGQQQGSAITDDRSLERDIQNSIQNQNVKVSVNNGVVTLRGTVNSDDEKRTIEDKVSSMPGVQDVDNQLTVASGANRGTSSYNTYSSTRADVNRTDTYTGPSTYDRTPSNRGTSTDRFNRDSSVSPTDRGTSPDRFNRDSTNTRTDTGSSSTSRSS
jgi:hypothetical protein